jgi:preprotein translocase subunit SecB
MSMASNGGPAAAPLPPESGLQPQLGVVAQYVKDLSFENPNAPRSLQTQVQPQIGIQINVNANSLSPTDFEVELRLEGKAEGGGNVLFSFELVFAGIFRIQNVPQDALQPLVMIECPRLLFPFAREIIASATRNGGFPPLLLDPIDFVALYQQRVAQMQAQQPPPTPPPAAA